MRTFITLTILFLFSNLLRAEDVKRPAADKERIIKTVRFLSAENHPRSAFQENKEKTIDYIVRSFSAAGLEATQSEFIIKTVLNDHNPSFANRENSVTIELYRHPYPLTNIHAVRMGKTDKRIIVAAHYDIIPESPGADDNASGVAVLIELAHMLKQTTELNCDVELVSYDAEEMGLLGSRYHAKQLKNQNVNVVCMVSMDLVGYYSDAEHSQNYPVTGMSFLYGTKGNFLVMVGRTENTKLLSVIQTAWKEATTLKLLALSAPKGLDLLLSRSDHAPFWWENYPALMLTDTADFRNKNYHAETDAWDTLDYDRLAQVPVGLYHVILMLDAAQ